MIIGSIVGALYHELDIFDIKTESYKLTPILIGASAMLGGYV